eukprot:15364944-Ditylum_brightwellii.AAC.3
MPQHTHIAISLCCKGTGTCSFYLHEKGKEKELPSPGKHQQHPGKQLGLRQQVRLLPSNCPLHQTIQTQFAFSPCQLTTPPKDNALQNNPFAPLAAKFKDIDNAAHSTSQQYVHPKVSPTPTPGPTNAPPNSPQ